MVTTICAMAVIAGLIGIFVYRVWSVMRECSLHDVGIGPYLCGCIDIPKEGALGKVMEGEEEIGENVGKVIHGEEGSVEGEVLSLEGNGGAISLDDVWVEVKDEGKSKAALKGKDRESEGRVVAGETVTCGKGWNGWC